MTMTTHRPYLVRALNEWILDNACTPYLLVNALEEGVQVPQDSVKDGQIILNISPTAVQGLVIRNDSVEFNARFAGIPTRVYVPIHAVMGIYARENGQGMIFDYESPQPPTDGGGPGNDKGERKGEGKSPEGGSRPALRVVK